MGTQLNSCTKFGLGWAHSIENSVSKNVLYCFLPKCFHCMLGFWDGHLWQWTISWECAFSPRDAFEYSKLVLLLNEVVLSSFEEDYLIWAPSKVGLFSVKSTLLELHKSSCPLTQISSKVYGAASFPIEFKSSHGYCSFKKINIKEKLARIGIIPQSNVV